MRLSILLPFVTLLGSAFAGCFSGGQAWPANTLGSLKKACNQLGGKNYTPNQERSARINIGGGSSCNNFVIKNTGSSGPFKVSKAECVDKMSKEFNGCEHGGRSSYGGKEVTADPNDGSCAKKRAYPPSAGEVSVFNEPRDAEMTEIMSEDFLDE